MPKSATNDAAFVTLVADTLHLRTAVARDVAAYWLALILATGTIALVYGVLRSRQGLALAAIRDNEAAAGSVGVDAFRTKFWVFVVAAFGSGLVGALIYVQKARIFARRCFLAARLDSQRHLHRRDRRHRYDRGTDRWRHGVLFHAELAGRLWGLVMMLLGALAIGVMLFCPRGLLGHIGCPIRNRVISAPTETADQSRRGAVRKICCW